MPNERSLESYFNAEEMDAALAYVEVFHGKFLLDTKLPRTDAVLLGLYMLCNSKKVSEVARNEASDFIRNMGVSSVDVSRGFYDLKEQELVSLDNSGNIGLSFLGLKKLRGMLQSSSSGRQSIAAIREVAGGQGTTFPSISSPGSLKETISSLLATDWGLKPRSLREITEALEANALYYPSSSIAANVNVMTKDQILRRMKSGGIWSYVLKKRPNETQKK